MRHPMSMENQPQPALGLDPVTGQPYSAPPAMGGPQARKLLAPLWHTVLVIIILLGNSFLTAGFTSRKAQNASAITENARMTQYGATILLEVILLGVVWVGLRLRKTKIRDLIGGRWKTPEDFLIDVAIAIGFWLVAVAVLAGLGYIFGLTRGTQASEAKRLAEMLGPRSTLGLVIWVCLSTTAGFVEEIIFRGYLQQQIAIVSGNIYAGLITSALIFGAGHGYEGTRRMVLIAVYGAMFGLLAHWRKSLRPGMMAHAWHDAFEGFVLRFVVQKGLPPMR